jgi:hypothetical protein
MRHTDEVDALAERFEATALSPGVSNKAHSSTSHRAATAARSRQFADYCLGMSGDEEDRLDMLCGTGAGGGAWTDDDRRHSGMGGGMVVVVGAVGVGVGGSEEPLPSLSGYMDDAKHDDHEDGCDNDYTNGAHHDPPGRTRHHDAHHQDSALPALTELTFKCPVIGGTYQQCFEGSSPVVAPPAGADKRVVGVNFDTTDPQSLELRLYLPKDESTTVIRLGNQWRWMAAAPVGYVISKGPIVAKKKVHLAS